MQNIIKCLKKVNIYFNFIFVVAVVCLKLLLTYGSAGGLLHQTLSLMIVYTSGK